MKLPKFISQNLLLKMTSLNAVVIIIRLIIGFFLQREISGIVSKTQYAQIGNFRNLIAQLSSFTSFGVFNGIVKYVSEHKNNNKELQKLFSTTTVFILIGSITAFLILFFGADFFSEKYFGSSTYAYLIKITAVVVPFISIQRVFNGFVSGLSLYKKFSKIELFAYLISSGLMIIFLYQKQFEGVIFAIAITPIIQVIVMLFVMVQIFKEFVKVKEIELKIPYAKPLLAFTLMSFASTIILNEVEVWVRNSVEEKLGGDEAGIWTGLLLLSKNYMVFINAILTLYVLPRFAQISDRIEFTKELGKIYKTILPLFACGMLLIYVFRFFIIDIQFKDDYSAMAPLFKWQLLGDFVRLASLILASQFLAKKMVYAFVFSELLSHLLFFGLSILLLDSLGLEAIPIAHLLRYVVYFAVVLFLVLRHFNRDK
ncbi:MAG: O-antigen translocase [Winogradskyella sp.]|uniref:O-antigen translocase n=1 Tax=Winogradskyella sp. TaxID=1883156 RepID=UPI0025EFAACE|nr:O-antigen translocase [Winogradskyella sp.]NRB61253.1 O-antigen translocase [Winogradskyella sp.]